MQQLSSLLEQSLFLPTINRILATDVGYEPLVKVLLIFAPRGLTNHGVHVGE